MGNISLSGDFGKGFSCRFGIDGILRNGLEFGCFGVVERVVGVCRG